MRVLALPDVHGNENVLKMLLAEKDNVDKIVQIGDFLDSHRTGNKWIQQHKVLSEFLKIKKELNSKKPGFMSITLGNHDLSYLSKFGGRSCSGHQFYQAVDIEEYLSANINEFEPFVIVDNWIFSHAGITQPYLEYLGRIFGNPKRIWNLEDIKTAFEERRFSIFNHHGNDPYGDSKDESCLWIRPPSLIRFGIDGFNQCVGHTVLEEGEHMDYWGLENRIVTGRDYYQKDQYFKWQYQEGEPSNLDNTYVFIDSPENSTYAIIDTITNKIEIKTLSQ